MSVLVTGGCGFVGINVAEELIARGNRVVLFDRIGLPSAADRLLRERDPRLAVVIGDVRDLPLLKAVFREHGVQRVIHTAVITAGATREAREPNEIIDVNLHGTVNILEAASSVGCERVIYVGSGQAYGATHEERVSLREDISPSRPEEVYGITKFAAEQIALRLGALWKISVISVRLGSVYATNVTVLGAGSISVIAPLCVVAGSCSTIAMLLEERGRAFLESQQVQWIGVGADGGVHGTAADLAPVRGTI